MAPLATNIDEKNLNLKSNQLILKIINIGKMILE